MWNMTHAHRLTLCSRLTSVKVWVHFLTLSARAASAPHRLLHPPEGPSALFTACTLHTGLWIAIWVMPLTHLRARMCYIVSHSIQAAVRGDTTELQPQQMMMWQPSVQIDNKSSLCSGRCISANEAKPQTSLSQMNRYSSVHYWQASVIWNNTLHTALQTFWEEEKQV